jgi:Domain of unknown function (DUF1737)
MFEIIAYKIVTQSVPELLAKEVNDLVQKGWQPFGNFVVLSDNTCAQAAVKYGDRKS